MIIYEMTLEELKQAVESKIKISFEIKEKFNEKVICVKGLKKNEKIEFNFSTYLCNDKYGERFISLGYSNNSGGGGRPCDSIDEVVEYIKQVYKEFGYIVPNARIKQLSLF